MLINWLDCFSHKILNYMFWNIWLLIGGLFCEADVSALAAVFPVFLNTSVKTRGSWRRIGAVGSSSRSSLYTGAAADWAAETARFCFVVFDLHPTGVRSQWDFFSCSQSCIQQAVSLSSKLSGSSSSSSSDVGCCARPCWEQRLPNLCGKPSSRYSHKRCGRRLLQIRNNSRYRPEEPERGTSVCLHWVRGPEVRRLLTASCWGLRQRHCVARSLAC